jgi:hypothetical protein
MRLLLTAALAWAAALPALADDLSVPPPPPLQKLDSAGAPPSSSAPPRHRPAPDGEQAANSSVPGSGKVTYGTFGPHSAPDTAKPPKGWTAQTP